MPFCFPVNSDGFLVIKVRLQNGCFACSTALHISRALLNWLHIWLWCLSPEPQDKWELLFAPPFSCALLCGVPVFPLLLVALSIKCLQTAVFFMTQACSERPILSVHYFKSVLLNCYQREWRAAVSWRSNGCKRAICEWEAARASVWEHKTNQRYDWLQKSQFWIWIIWLYVVSLTCLKLTHGLLLDRKHGLIITWQKSVLLGSHPHFWTS